MSREKESLQTASNPQPLAPVVPAVPVNDLVTQDQQQEGQDHEAYSDDALNDAKDASSQRNREKTTQEQLRTGPKPGALEWFLSENHCRYARVNQRLEEILRPQLTKGMVRHEIHVVNDLAATLNMSSDKLKDLLETGLRESQRLGISSVWAVRALQDSLAFQAATESTLGGR